MISLLQSASFFLVCFVIILFERFKLISSDVSSLFLLDIKRFKLISSDVSSLFLLVECHWSRLTLSVVQADLLLSNKLSWWDQYRTRLWSRLTITSCLLHACSKACFIHVIEADSLLSDELDDEINIERVFEADLLSLRVYYMHVAELISFIFTTCM